VQTDSDTEQMGDTERERAVDAAGIPDPAEQDDGGPLSVDGEG
jgi:hypothetical protein